MQCFLRMVSSSGAQVPEFYLAHLLTREELYTHICTVHVRCSAQAVDIELRSTE